MRRSTPNKTNISHIHTAHPITKDLISINNKIFILYRYLLRIVIPPFLVSLLLFTFFVETLDILINLIRYLERDIPLIDIMWIQLLYLPTSLSYALPVAILFSITFSIGQLYAHNELIAILTSGVSLFRFVLPLIALGALFGIGNYYFKEYVVIETFRQKNELTRIYLNQQISQSNSKVAILQDGGNIVYFADYYNDIATSLDKPIIIITNDDNILEMRINASEAVWNGTLWVFNNANIYKFDSTTSKYTIESHDIYTNPAINVFPEKFKRIITNTEEMRYNDAMEYIAQLKESGHPYKKLLTDTYSRIPLALSPFIVMLLACFAGSVFRKNTMLMSLLNALISAVLYYSTDLLGSVLSTRNVLPPFLGAWIGFIVTILLCVLAYRYLIK